MNKRPELHDLTHFPLPFTKARMCQIVLLSVFVPRVDTEFYLIRRRFDVQPVKDDTIGEDIFPKIKNNVKMSYFL